MSFIGTKPDVPGNGVALRAVGDRHVARRSGELTGLSLWAFTGLPGGSAGTPRACRGAIWQRYWTSYGPDIVEQTAGEAAAAEELRSLFAEKPAAETVKPEGEVKPAAEEPAKPEGEKPAETDVESVLKEAEKTAAQGSKRAGIVKWLQDTTDLNEERAASGTRKADCGHRCRQAGLDVRQADDYLGND